MQYDKTALHPRILGLTASPGSDMEKIKEVAKNLFIENIEIRTENDPDVRPYMKDIKMNWVKVTLPDEFKKIQKYLKDCIKTKVVEIKEYEVITNIYSDSSKKELLGMQAHLQSELSQGNKDFKRDMFNVVIGIIWQTSMVVIPIYLIIEENISLISSIAILLITSLILKKNWWDKLTD
jgi:Fanconi anemia group M protein